MSSARTGKAGIATPVCRRDVLVGLARLGAGAGWVVGIAACEAAKKRYEDPTLGGKLTYAFSTDVPENKIQDFMAYSRKAYNVLTAYLGVEPRPVHVDVGDHSRTRTLLDRTIQIPTSRVVSRDHWPGESVHELTHALTDVVYPWLGGPSARLAHLYSEGLAMHAEFRFGNRTNVDIHPFVRRAWARDEEIHPAQIEARNIVVNAKDHNQKRSATLYIVAGSFVTWLIEDVLRGDAKKFVAFHMWGDYGDDTHVKTFGKTLRELDRDWLAFIHAYGSAARKHSSGQTIY